MSAQPPTFAALERACQNFARGMAAYIAAVRPAFERLAAGIHKAAWSAYRAAGMPYGETQDGLLRWMRERSQAEGLRARAERIESIHAACARLRSGRGAQG